VHGNAIKEFVDKHVDALIKALTERKLIALQSLSKANKECNDLLGEVTRQQQIYQDMIKQCDEVALFQKMKTIKSYIANLKVDVSRFPSATNGHFRPWNPNMLIFQFALSYLIPLYPLKHVLCARW
jgi:hypothetical protein